MTMLAEDKIELEKAEKLNKEVELLRKLFPRCSDKVIKEAYNCQSLRIENYLKDKKDDKIFETLLKISVAAYLEGYSRYYK